MSLSQVGGSADLFKFSHTGKQGLRRLQYLSFRAMHPKKGPVYRPCDERIMRVESKKYRAGHMSMYSGGLNCTRKGANGGESVQRELYMEYVHVCYTGNS